MANLSMGKTALSILVQTSECDSRPRQGHWWNYLDCPIIFNFENSPQYEKVKRRFFFKKGRLVRISALS